jgi:hypothetical protein
LHYILHIVYFNKNCETQKWLSKRPQHGGSELTLQSDFEYCCVLQLASWKIAFQVQGWERQFIVCLTISFTVNLKLYNLHLSVLKKIEIIEL